MSEAWKVDMPKISLKTLTKGSVMLLATPHQRKQLASKAKGHTAPRGKTAREAAIGLESVMARSE